MPKKEYIEKLQILKEQDNLRTLLSQTDKNLIDLCSNDYLGYAKDTHLQSEFLQNYQPKQGDFSASASRLLGGSVEELAKLEATIETAYNRSCLVFNSTYHLNVGVLPTLAKKGDLIIADKLIHASLIDGIGLSQATFKRYPHLDYDHLEKILIKERHLYNNIFIVNESIFSMDGDLVDLDRLIAIKKQYNTLLYLDEAHAVGVRGQSGLGLAEEQNVLQEIDFLVGAFGKALASVGGYIICDQLFKDYLVNHARTFIYTTALPPINVAWSRYIFEKQLKDTQSRETLFKLIKEFSNLLGVHAHSQIVPFLIGSNHKAIERSKELQSKGFKVLPIRPPTVPKGTARLRCSLNANLEITQLKPLKQTLDQSALVVK